MKDAKKMGASIKLRRKEIFEDGWGISNFNMSFNENESTYWHKINRVLKISMESYKNKRRKLLKIHFFINLRKKKIIFLRANFCVIKQKFENTVEFLWKSPKRVTYSLTNNISHDHICYFMCNVNMLIIVITCIIIHDVLVFYGLRSHRKLINLFWIATRRPLRWEVNNLSLTWRVR